MAAMTPASVSEAVRQRCPMCAALVAPLANGSLPQHLAPGRERLCTVGAPVDPADGCPLCGTLAGRYNPQAVTDMVVSEFTDAQGAEHVHDPNYQGRSFTCANGHTYRKGPLSSCFCGWT